METEVIRVTSELKFIQKAEEAANKLKNIQGKSRLLSHIDADGITASAIIQKTFERLNRDLVIEHVPSLDVKKIEEIKTYEEEIILFTDLGSGQYKKIKEDLPHKQVFILDHHETDEPDTETIMHLNPHTVGITSSKSVSGSGVAFFFSKAIDKQNEDLAHIALVGAIGDVQEDRGFSGLNKIIQEIAENTKQIQTEQTLRIYGLRTRPLANAMKLSDHKIPTVTDKDSAAYSLLNQLRINPKKEKIWKTFAHLTKEEQKNLTEYILVLRSQHRDKIDEPPEEIIGPVFLLNSEHNESPLKDLRDYATIINACGRLGEPEVGRHACIGGEETKQEAIKIMKKYRSEISKALRWTHSNEHLTGENYMIINAETNVKPTIIGTVASILSKSSTTENEKFILSMAVQTEETTKVSFRQSKNENNHNLKEIIEELCLKVEGQSGGHKEAAGAILKRGTEQKFIEEAIKKFQELLN